MEFVWRVGWKRKGNIQGSRTSGSPCSELITTTNIIITSSQSTSPSNHCNQHHHQIIAINTEKIMVIIDKNSEEAKINTFCSRTWVSRRSTETGCIRSLQPLVDLEYYGLRCHYHYHRHFDHHCEQDCHGLLEKTALENPIILASFIVHSSLTFWNICTVNWSSLWSSWPSWSLSRRLSLCWWLSPSESQKPCQRVSNADQKVFANPESFCDKFIIGWRISGYFAIQNIQIICKVSGWTGKFPDNLKSVRII